jgi:hypothetical protein
MELVQNIGENAASSSDLRALFHSPLLVHPCRLLAKACARSRAQNTEQTKSSIVMAREL